MIKYIKFFGTNGSGKTTMIRELSKVLTGIQCDHWKNVDKPPIITYNVCNCNIYAAVGIWGLNNKINGIDCLRSDKYHTFQISKNKKTFNYKEKIESNLLEESIKASVIFEDGLVTYSPGIQEALNSKFEFYTFLLDYPIEFCINNYKKRGSIIGEKTIQKIREKQEGTLKIYDRIKVSNKYKLSSTLEENIHKVITITNLIPCNCMKGIINKQKISLFNL